MKFNKKLVHGRLIRRYKRFLADVKLEDGQEITAHCTNSGSMKTCLEEGAEVYLSPVDDPKRKTQFTWEMIMINGKWIGINTNHPNLLAYEAIRSGQVPGLRGYDEVKREVKFQDSRFDVMAKSDKETCFIEVKNVTMKDGDFALFPDAKTERGRKHLQTLIRVKEESLRAVMFYVVQRMDVAKAGPAVDIDPAYADALKKAIDSGVEVIAMQAEVSPDGIDLVKETPFQWPH
ncbi:Sugar fermentation stimulation protein A [Salinivirga cyanobacteriivorans]|uniref:Sugar fermentation stimulation protein homolog n=1 Tax=Salinivirga cyanobacteriivorans TaxID=1307839 RepID=A0A0S2HYM0_9BACT|nr:DNA/RNA nuclease SfsA [Salinivirga cyanobacteriivorans]ALO15152.1 Sugar fermentation stimulation protein A [Salinivirga cyanobacteriivorans]